MCISASVCGSARVTFALMNTPAQELKRSRCKRAYALLNGSQSRLKQGISSRIVVTYHRTRIRHTDTLLIKIAHKTKRYIVARRKHSRRRKLGKRVRSFVCASNVVAAVDDQRFIISNACFCKCLLIAYEALLSRECFEIQDACNSFVMICQEVLSCDIAANLIIKRYAIGNKTWNHAVYQHIWNALLLES